MDKEMMPLELEFSSQNVAEDDYSSLCFTFPPRNEEGWSTGQCTISISGNQNLTHKPIWFCKEDFVHLQRKIEQTINSKDSEIEFEPLEPVVQFIWKHLPSEIRLSVKIDEDFIGGGTATDNGIEYSIRTSIDQLKLVSGKIDFWISENYY